MPSTSVRRKVSLRKRAGSAWIACFTLADLDLIEIRQTTCPVATLPLAPALGGAMPMGNSWPEIMIAMRSPPKIWPMKSKGGQNETCCSLVPWAINIVVWSNFLVWESMPTAKLLLRKDQQESLGMQKQSLKQQVPVLVAGMQAHKWAVRHLHKQLENLPGPATLGTWLQNMIQSVKQ